LKKKTKKLTMSMKNITSEKLKELTEKLIIG